MVTRIKLRVENGTDREIDRGGVTFPPHSSREVTVTPFRAQEVRHARGLVVVEESEVGGEPVVDRGTAEQTYADAGEKLRDAERQEAEALDAKNRAGAVLRDAERDLEAEKRSAALSGEDVMGVLGGTQIETLREQAESAALAHWGAQVRRLEAEAERHESRVPVAAIMREDRDQAIAEGKARAEAAQEDLRELEESYPVIPDAFSLKRQAADTRRRRVELEQEGPQAVA